MKIAKFKTNIKCDGCVSTVSPFLNSLATIKEWEVDLQNPDRILTIHNDSEIDVYEVINALKKAGYKAEVITD